MFSKLSNWLLQSNNLALATTGFVFGVMILYIIYNTMAFYILKEKYHGIRFTTKNIAYITMFAAISVSVTIVISLTIPITVFPPIRIAFEGVMVKITGFIFGPIVGIIVGLVTELLVTLFVPSYIHIAYTLCAIAYGFISGVGASFLRAGKGKEWIMFALIHVFIFAFGGFMYYLISSYNQNVSVLSFEVSPKVYRGIFVGVMVFILVIVWIITLSFKFKEYKKISMELKKTKRAVSKAEWKQAKSTVIKQNKSEALRTLLPIILFCTAIEFLVTTLMSAWGDATFLGVSSNPGGYTGMVVSRLVQAPIKVVFNTFILYFTYNAVRPLIKRDR